VHADDAGRAPTHGSEALIGRGEADRHTLARHEKQVVVFLHEQRGDEFIAFAQLDRDDAA
jgi:hypothetical protein